MRGGAIPPLMLFLIDSLKILEIVTFITAPESTWGWTELQVEYV